MAQSHLEVKQPPLLPAKTNTPRGWTGDGNHINRLQETTGSADLHWRTILTQQKAAWAMVRVWNSWQHSSFIQTKEWARKNFRHEPCRAHRVLIMCEEKILPVHSDPEENLRGGGAGGNQTATQYLQHQSIITGWRHRPSGAGSHKPGSNLSVFPKGQKLF